MPKSSISIHGSCLSRDIFSYVPNNKIIINNYIARQSILSSISNPLNCNLENIGLESKFQNDMVLCYLNKLIFSRLIENKSIEYISNINNKWGLSPFHYEEKYYKLIIKI